MRTIIFLVLFSMLAAGCAPPIKRLHEISPNVPLNPISIEDAFKERETFHLRDGANISVSTGQVPLVNLGNNNLLVVPVFNDGSKPHTVKVKSYVTRKDDGSYILFYPILSFIDQNFHAYLTVKPKYEFAFHENVLTNEFEIPAGVERLLIHTDKEFFDGEFESTTSKGSAPGGAYGVAGVLGGVVGALILKAATEGDEKPFKFDKVGVIRVETN